MTARFVDVPLDRLQPHPRNNRRGDLPSTLASIKRLGFQGAIVVQRSTGYVLAGNTRLRAMRELGRDTIPVQYVDWDDEKSVSYLLADNRTHDLGTYDDGETERLLAELRGTEYDDLLTALQWDEPTAPEPPPPKPADPTLFGITVLVESHDDRQRLLTSMRTDGYQCWETTIRSSAVVPIG